MNDISKTGKSLDYSPSSQQKSSTKELGIHFFTIVLNGEPFIRYHIEVFKKLPFPWHWHIVEGVAKRIKDTARVQGKNIDEFHKKGHSKDGTLTYIKDLAKQYPDNVIVYTKEDGSFWNGKLEMVNAPLKNIQEECLLWQVDVDEFWTPNQIIKARNLFLNHPEKTAAYYWCLFFVGVHLVITTRNGYAQNPTFEWLRTWRFTPGAHWKSHAPPQLVQTQGDTDYDLAYINPFLHHETEIENLVFQHFAYIRSEQIQFKEAYYGYQGAKEKWLKLQSQAVFPVFLKEYFDWVDDNTMVNTIQFCEITPLISIDSSGNFTFKDLSELYQKEDFKFYNSQSIETAMPRTLAKHQLDRLIQMIEAIENSKIWKIRSFILKLLGKKVLELSKYLENGTVESQLEKSKIFLSSIEASKTWKVKQKWLKLKNLIVF